MENEDKTAEETTTVDKTDAEVDHSDIDVKAVFEDLKNQLDQLKAENEELKKNSTQTSEMQKREAELKKFIAGFTGRGGSAPTREAHQEEKREEYVSEFEKLANVDAFDLSVKR